MKTRPFKYINNFLKDKLERTRKLDEFIHLQTDSFITWIIGFSFTGLLLIVANLEKLQTKTPTKFIVICLFICVILGIAFRIISFLITLFQKLLDDYFYGLFTENEMTPIYLDEDIENMEFPELLLLIKNDFDQVIYQQVNPDLPEDVKEREEIRLRNHYLNLINHSKKEFDIAINYAADIDQTAYKIDKEKTLGKLKDIRKAFKDSKIGYNQKRWYNTRTIVYFACLLSFMIAISILCFSLIKMLP